MRASHVLGGVSGISARALVGGSSGLVDCTRAGAPSNAAFGGRPRLNTLRWPRSRGRRRRDVDDGAVVVAAGQRRKGSRRSAEKRRRSGAATDLAPASVLVRAPRNNCPSFVGTRAGTCFLTTPCPVRRRESPPTGHRGGPQVRAVLLRRRHHGAHLSLREALRAPAAAV